jgi:hypothetical protein
VIDQIEGLPRSYFYRRIADALHEVIQRNTSGEDQQPAMVAKVNLQEAMSRLVSCPVCGAPLGWMPDFPLEKSCDCGDFTITEVWANGDVTFTFIMISPEKVESNATNNHDGGGDDSISERG